jgi:peptide-methionine (S)-S-oxide reductase
MTYQKATFGMGCFWGAEEAFRGVKGVVSTTVGWMGGRKENPTYKEVITGMTGHAEVVHLEYDPSEISYDELLKIFWENIDPTTLNRQGPDEGTEYRTVIFYHSEEQGELARRSKEDLERSGRYNKPIVTEIIQATAFWRAEEYHQHYFEKHGGSCH